jgi:hypothetical protein
MAYLPGGISRVITMGRLRLLIAAGAVFLMAIGCDHGERISRLEKQSEELKAEVKKDHATADYELQAKCSRDSRVWFKENWSADKNTILLDYTNHYNKAQNKCFILVERHYSWDKSDTWTNDMTLWDVYENSKYGSFDENTMSYFKPAYHSESSVITCELLGTKCKTVEEFNNLVRPYLNN